MSTYIQNYGFTKTLINNNNKLLNNEIKWEGNYDGSKANIYVDINENGKKEIIKMKLDNNDIEDLLGIPSVEIPLEERLKNDFLYNSFNDSPTSKSPRSKSPRSKSTRSKSTRSKSIVLEGALVKKRTRKNRLKLLRKKRKSITIS
jgi:hypothetical protein